MTENIKFWLKNLYMEEITEAIGAAKNEHLWALGSDGEQAEWHEANFDEQREYISILKQLLNNVDETKHSRSGGFAVITSKSSCSMNCVRLFKDIEKAKDFLTESYKKELEEIDGDGLTLTKYIDPERTFGVITNGSKIITYSMGMVE